MNQAVEVAREVVRWVREVMVRRVVGGRMSRRARMLGGGGVSEGVEGGRGTMGGVLGGVLGGEGFREDGRWEIGEKMCGVGRKRWAYVPV